MDTILDFMQENDIPLTRENYLEIAYMGTPPAELSAEEESMLPEKFQIWKRRRMKQPKLTRLEYDAQMKPEAASLIRQGQMPPLDEVLRAIEESRQKYRMLLDQLGQDRST